MNLIYLICAGDVGKSLEIMWKGMLAIFIVIAVVAVVSYLLNKFINKAETAKAEKLKKQEEQNNSDQNNGVE